MLNAISQNLLVRTRIFFLPWVTSFEKVSGNVDDIKYNVRAPFSGTQEMDYSTRINLEQKLGLLNILCNETVLEQWQPLKPPHYYFLFLSHLPSSCLWSLNK